MKINQDSDGVIRIYVDASSLSKSSCLRYFKWTVIDGYVSGSFEEDFSLAYGNAYHKFLERFYTNVHLQENLDLTHASYMPMQEKLKYSDSTILTLRHLGESCKAYAKIYGECRDTIVPLIVDGKYCVEQQFAFPIWRSADGKIEIIISGTIDLKGTFADIQCIVDHKTTQSYYKQGYFDKFYFDIQMMLYTWAERKITGRDSYLPVVVNGIFLKKPTQKAEEAKIWDGVKFERSNLIPFTNESMEEFEGWLKRRLGEFIAFFGSKENISLMDKLFDMTMCKSYGLCKFYDVCRRGPKLQQTMLETLFKQKRYEPLKFRL